MISSNEVPLKSAGSNIQTIFGDIKTNGQLADTQTTKTLISKHSLYNIKKERKFSESKQHAALQASIYLLNYNHFSADNKKVPLGSLHHKDRS